MTAITASPDGPKYGVHSQQFADSAPDSQQCFQNLAKTTMVISTGMMNMKPVTTSLRRRLKIACMKSLPLAE